MAFTVTTMKCSDRRTLLNRAMSLMQELIRLNESADAARKVLIDQSVADVGDTINKTLGAAGPPFVSAATDITPTGDTIADELILIISTSTGGIGYQYLAE